MGFKGSSLKRESARIQSKFLFGLGQWTLDFSRFLPNHPLKRRVQTLNHSGIRSKGIVANFFKKVSREFVFFIRVDSRFPSFGMKRLCKTYNELPFIHARFFHFERGERARQNRVAPKIANANREFVARAREMHITFRGER